MSLQTSLNLNTNLGTLEYKILLFIGRIISGASGGVLISGKEFKKVFSE